MAWTALGLGLGLRGLDLVLGLDNLNQFKIIPFTTSEQLTRTFEVLVLI